MRLNHVTFVLLLICVLLFATNCSCEKQYELDPLQYWVVCQQQADGTNQPVLTNGKITKPGGYKFNNTQYSCPDTAGSPVWQGSGQQVYGTTPIHSSARGFGQKAITPGSAAYLPPPLLDLPFPAQPSSSDSTALVCDPNQPDVIQVNHDNASVNRISTCPFQPIVTIPVVTRPLQIAITPDGLTALVTSFDNAINFIDLTSNKVTFTLFTGGNIFPNGIAITPDGTTAYVTNFAPAGASIVEYDLTARQQIFSISAPAYPQNAVLSPDGAQLFVTFPYENQVWIIDTLTNTLAFTIQIRAPRGIAFNSKGTKAYIASTDIPDGSESPGTVQEFDTNTFQVTNTYKVGVGPNDVAVLYSDQFVVVNNYEGQSISKIDTVSGTVTTTPMKGMVSSLSIVK